MTPATRKRRLTQMRRARWLLNPNYNATVEPAVQWCWNWPETSNARAVAASLALDGLPARWPRKPPKALP